MKKKTNLENKIEQMQKREKQASRYILIISIVVGILAAILIMGLIELF
ncbi:MAG: hypothetical protein KDC52_16215 [Ignavibacteriae bacterium]|nr:hypothetical protein [Ignavibacteriota bacterium]